MVVDPATDPRAAWPLTRSSFRSIDRQVTVAFTVALAMLLAVTVFARARVASADVATEWVDHTHRVLEAIDRVRIGVAEATAEQRGYVLTRDPVRLQRHRVASRSVDSALATLRRLTVDNPLQQRRLDSMQTQSRQLLAELDALTALADTRGDSAVRAAMTRRGAKATIADFGALQARMTADELMLLAQRTARQVRERRAARGAALLGGLIIFALAVSGALRVRSALVVRARAESERDAHADALVIQASEVEAQNRELIAQGEALQRAMDQAESANRAKSTFLAQMSHELRTPLNSVIGFANIVRRNSRDALNALELTYLARIAENGRQLLRTIDRILDLSKIEADQESVAFEMVSLDVLVRDVLAQLEPQATTGHITLAAQLPTPLAALVSDEEKLRRVLINLVANAVKFTRAGGRVVVRVETAWRAPTTPVAIEVRDTGIGIAPERLALIFEPFEQGDVGVSREFGGTGLGLSISRALCRLLHCELTVASVVGQGTVFRVALPTHDAIELRPDDPLALGSTRER